MEPDVKISVSPRTRRLVRVLSGLWDVPIREAFERLVVEAVRREPSLNLDELLAEVDKQGDNETATDR